MRGGKRNEMKIERCIQSTDSLIDIFNPSILGLMMLCGAILDLTSAAFLTPPTSRNVVMN